MIWASFWRGEWNQLITLKQKASPTTICTMSIHFSTTIYRVIFFFFIDLCIGWVTRTSSDAFVFNFRKNISGLCFISPTIYIVYHHDTVCNSKRRPTNFDTCKFFNAILFLDYLQLNSFVKIYSKWINESNSILLRLSLPCQVNYTTKNSRW